MERDFLLPDVGEGLEDATVVQWHVQVGDTIGLNQPLVTIETAKAAVELPSPFEGTVVHLSADEGAELRVGDLLARIDTPEGAAPRAPSPASPAPPPEAPAMEPPAPPAMEPPAPPAIEQQEPTTPPAPTRQPVLVGYGVDEERRRASDRRVWRRHKAQPGTSPRDASAVADTDAPSSTARPLAKPPVRWLARVLGTDLRLVKPTGSGGEVTREDVRAAAASAPGAPAVPVAPSRDGRHVWWPAGTDEDIGDAGPHAVRASGDAATDEDVEELPVRGVRARIADRMSVSRSTIPEATCGLWVDCEALLALRSSLQDDLQRGSDPEGPAPEQLTPFAVLSWMVPFALRTAPLLNATFDAANKVIRVHRAVHLGIATTTDHGLLVPVLRAAHAHGLFEFAAQLAHLTRSAREGTLTPAELTGSTFTITNYGALGLDDGNPVINAPEAGILGVGTIAPRAAVFEGSLAVRSTTKLICSFDHRVCDGAEAARFLRRLKTLVERPHLLLAQR